MSKEVNAEDLRFVTDEGMFGFISLSPLQKPDKFGWSYKADLIWDLDAKNTSYKNALANLVQSVTDKRAIPKGLIQKLEDTERDPDKNPHLTGKLFSAFKKKVNPKERNLSDPEERKKWLTYVATMQPVLFKLNEKGEREPAQPGDFYSGCFGKIIGHCYFNTEFKKYCITMDYVILTRKGERIGGGPIDPDSDELLDSVAKKAAPKKDDVDKMLSGGTEEFDEIPF